MSTPPGGSAGPGGGGPGPGGPGAREPTEEELRAAYEAELKRITIADVVLQTVVSLVNLAGRRLGLAPGSEDERDMDQVRDAIDSVRALMPVLERAGVPEINQIRDAVSRLQLAYAREQASAPAESGGESGPAEAPSGRPENAAAPAGKPGGQRPEGEEGRQPGPAESSGRLWVPGR